MTIYMINHRPHIAMDNYYKEISQYEFYMMLETETNLHIEDVNVYD